MRIIFIFSIIFLINCNGEKVGEINPINQNIEKFFSELNEVKKPEIFITSKLEIENETEEPLGLEELRELEELEELLKQEFGLDEGFELKGHYGEKGCEGRIYRKEYQVSWLYAFVDCKNNIVKQLVRK